MIQRRKFRTREAQRRERIRVTLKFVGVVALFAVVAVPLYYGLHTQPVRISDVFVSTNGAIPTEQVASAIWNELEGTYLWLIPKNSAFLVRNSSLETMIRDSYPRVSDVRVKRAGFHTINATLKEREPVALWCGDIVPTIANNTTKTEDPLPEELWGICYWMDENSFIYARAPMYTGNMYPRYYGPLDNADPIAQNYIQPEEFDAWQTFYTSFSTEELQAHAILFVDERDVELYLTNGLRVLMPRTEDTDLIQRRLEATLAADVIDLNREVAYLDLRFGGKAFVKYIDEVEE